MKSVTINRKLTVSDQVFILFIWDTYQRGGWALNLYFGGINRGSKENSHNHTLKCRTCDLSLLIAPTFTSPLSLSPNYLLDGNWIYLGSWPEGPNIYNCLSNFFTELVPMKGELVLTRPSVIMLEIFSTLMVNVKYVGSWVCCSWTLSAHILSFPKLEHSCTLSHLYIIQCLRSYEFLHRLIQLDTFLGQCFTITMY